MRLWHWILSQLRGKQNLKKILHLRTLDFKKADTWITGTEKYIYVFKKILDQSVTLFDGKIANKIAIF